MDVYFIVVQIHNGTRGQYYIVLPTEHYTLPIFWLYLSIAALDAHVVHVHCSRVSFLQHRNSWNMAKTKFETKRVLVMVLGFSTGFVIWILFIMTSEDTLHNDIKVLRTVLRVSVSIITKMYQNTFLGLFRITVELLTITIHPRKYCTLHQKTATQIGI